MKYIQTILPSEVYTSLGARDNIRYLCSNQGLRIVGFAPPEKGQQYLAAPSGATVNNEEYGGGAARPRFIVTPKSEIESWWE